MYQNVLLILQCFKHHQYVSSFSILDFSSKVKNIYPYGTVNVSPCPVTFIKHP